jgi:hypothetical protein
MTKDEIQAAFDDFNIFVERINKYYNTQGLSNGYNDFLPRFKTVEAIRAALQSQLTKTNENVTCENLSNTDERSLKNWIFAWAADVKGLPLNSDINDLIWVIEKHVKEQSAQVKAETVVTTDESSHDYTATVVREGSEIKSINITRKTK